MAARLIQRCTRHLSASFLTVSTPAIVLTACRWTPAELYQSSTSLAGIHTSVHHHIPDLTPATEYTCQPEHIKVDELIESALNTEELLQISSEHTVTGNQAAALLIRLCRHIVEQKLDTQDVLRDSRFQHLLNAVDGQISSVWNGNLVSLLRSLFAIKLDARNRVLRSVENEIHWRLRRLSLKNLASLAGYYTSYAQTDGQKVLLSDIIKNVELRWTEITDAKTVTTLMTKLGPLSSALMGRLEDKGLELAEFFTPDDTRKVALALAMQNRRTIPLLRALSYHFMQKNCDLKTGVLVDMAFAYGKLNFQQTQVFQRLAAELLPRVPELSPMDVMRCTKSFAYLKWLNLPLFEALAQYVVEHCDNMTEMQLCNIIMAFARLNYQPTIGEAFYAKIHEKLSSALVEMEPFLLVDLVWSLCILQQVSPLYLSEVLDHHFFQRITEGTQTQKSENYKLKLVHINATAQLECSDYNGPYLPTHCLDSWISGTRKNLSPLSSGVRETLQTAVGDQTKCRCGVNTTYGWVIDGEVVLDSENKPLVVQEYTAPHGPQSEGSKPLPFGAKRLAFVVREFPNYNSRSRDLLGRFAMARRHLLAAGFLVVEVPYYDWLELKSDWQKVAYLKDKMGKAIAEDMVQ
ncbi:FAST kinase domain-containing protein 4 [Chiloscyllium plagiosum]|uniref:FAST kinase domain-containing protein 4 n=1 Tax=Chiloscyllium plagiosum TaxID=36176 RepID=UPI001CB8502E|nr:FAST kinase domain-containing protein 4 [Chiloscyllium plagiosum]